ncbi:MAG TPA: hypothetical protein VGD48_18185 [Kutzneria sp.]|jgi:hypothetical protein
MAEPAEHTSVHVGGNLTGQVNVGDGNTLSWQHVQAGGVTAAELAELRAAVDALRTALAGEPEAVSKLDELETALTGDSVDVPAVAQAHGWFRRTLPGLIGAVNRIVFGPIVAKLVAAGGDGLAAEFSRRLGG